MRKEKVINELAERGLEWLSEDYQNLDTPLKLKCKEGHEFFDSVKNTRKKKWKCPMCEEDNVSFNNVEPKKHARILGLDNATDKCGFAIIENGVPIFYGTHKVKTKDTIARIAEVKQWFATLCKEYDVDVTGFENVYYSGNPQTLIVLSMLLGTLCVDAYEKQYDLYCLSASEWRSIVGLKSTKRTRDSLKRAAQQMVKTKFNLNVSQDTAEAILIGLATEKKYSIEQQQQEGFGFTKD